MTSIETADGAQVASVNMGAGKLADAILTAALERWNLQHGEHMTLKDFEAAIAHHTEHDRDAKRSLGSLAIALVAGAGKAAGTLAEAAHQDRPVGTFERHFLAQSLGEVMVTLAQLARELEVPLPAVACGALVARSPRADYSAA